MIAVLRVLRTLVPHLRERGGGRVVNLASGAGLAGTALMAPYSASKHAVVGLCRTAARELAADRIAVNALCPGCVDSPMMTRIEAAVGGSFADAVPRAGTLRRGHRRTRRVSRSGGAALPHPEQRSSSTAPCAPDSLGDAGSVTCSTPAFGGVDGAPSPAKEGLSCDGTRRATAEVRPRSLRVEREWAAHRRRRRRSNGRELGGSRRGRRRSRPRPGRRRGLTSRLTRSRGSNIRRWRWMKSEATSRMVARRRRPRGRAEHRLGGELPERSRRAADRQVLVGHVQAQPEDRGQAQGEDASTTCSRSRAQASRSSVRR